VYKAIRKHGIPLCRILCIGSKDYIVDLEIQLIAILHTRKLQYGYNVTLGGELSPSQTSEVAAKISAANKGRLKGLKRPSEVCARISAGKKGWKPSPEAVAKMRAMKMGRPSWNKGKKWSLEVRSNISAAAKKRSPVSDETRAKMSATRKGRSRPPFTDEHRANMSASAKNRRSALNHEPKDSPTDQKQQKPQQDMPAERRVVS
jgi:hypothetical protein